MANEFRPMQMSDAAETARTQVNFINQVYGWMSLGLGVSALIAWRLGTYLLSLTPEQFMSIRGWIWGALIGQFVLVMVISAGINRMSSVTAGILFTVYAAVTGAALSPVVVAYTGASLASTFVATAATFGGMSLYGYVTKRDLTGIGSLCGMALWGLIIASLVNMFWGNSTLYWVISYVGIAIFVGLTAYDTQKIKQMAIATEDGMIDSESARKGAIVGALALYLDFINLFLLLLRFFGNRR